MEVDRFLVKPVEIEIQGIKVMIEPLTTKFYPLITKLSYYTQRILSARSKLKPGQDLDLEGLFTIEELKHRAEIESEIAYLTLEKTFDNFTKEKFEQMPASIINEIMKGALRANGMTDEKLDDIRKALIKNDKSY